MVIVPLKNPLSSPTIFSFSEHQLQRSDVRGQVCASDQPEEASGLRHLLHNLDQTLHHRHHPDPAPDLLQLQGWLPWPQ